MRKADFKNLPFDTEIKKNLIMYLKIVSHPYFSIFFMHTSCRHIPSFMLVLICVFSTNCFCLSISTHECVSTWELSAFLTHLFRCLLIVFFCINCCLNEFVEIRSEPPNCMCFDGNGGLNLESNMQCHMFAQAFNSLFLLKHY